MTVYDAAYAIGEVQGAAAATWVEIGATERATALLTGINDGDPCILEELPQPDLSGQFADRYSSHDLIAELDCPDEEWGAACEGYEAGFADTLEQAVAQRCTAYLEGAER
jgi:hypothetical protein